MSSSGAAPAAATDAAVAGLLGNAASLSRGAADPLYGDNAVAARVAAASATRTALDGRYQRGGAGIDIRSFGLPAVGDGSDATAAIQAAINAAPQLRDAVPIDIPPGDFGAAELDVTNKHILFRSESPYFTRLRYNGAGGVGTALTKCTTNLGGAIPAGGFVGLDLQGTAAGGAQCENLFKKTGNTSFDWDFRLAHIILRGCSGDGFDFGPARIVNLHAERFRVDGLGGWAFRMASTAGGEHNPITFDKFTVDCGTSGVLKGLLRIDNGKGYYVRISNARLEGNLSLIPETIGAVTEASWILNNNQLASGSFGAYFWLDNVMGFTPTPDVTTSLVRDSGLAGNAIRGRLDVVNFDHTSEFRCDNVPAQNLGVNTPQNMQTRFFTKG